MPLSLNHPNLALDTPLVIAVSGGADSVSLLHLLKEAGFEDLIVAHLDHQLRPNSQQEAEFVRGLATSWGYTYELKTMNIAELTKKTKDNLEQVGRDARYEFFRELKEKHRGSFIVTAHHADDQIETVLMNMIRGCGLDGLGGMQQREADLWRPLLPYSKGAILDYCATHQLQYIEDESNRDITFKRNFLRHEIIPKLKELNPNLNNTFIRNIQHWKQASDLLISQSLQFIREHQSSKHRYSLKPFLLLSETLQALTLRELFAQTHGHKRNLDQAHLDQVLKILRHKSAGKQKEFGQGKVLLRHRNHFEIQ